MSDDLKRQGDEIFGPETTAKAATPLGDIELQAERRTPIRYFVSARRGADILHVDLLELGKADKRDVLAARIADVAKLPLPDVEAALINVMREADLVWQSEAADREGGGPPEKQAEQLLELCGDVALEHDADNVGYATWIHDCARQTHRLRTAPFKTWLAWKAYTELELVPSNNAMQEALTTLEGKAIHAGKLVKVHRRVAEHLDKLYVDLCDEKWRAVEIGKDGWRIVSDPPVRFTRGTGMLPLPEPTKGALGALRPFLNVADETDFEVCLAWLVGALQARGPFPILALSGVQGSAKSTAAELLIGVVDPNKAPMRSLPKSEDDLVVTVQHGRVIGLDNVSGLSAEMSDALCRLATGGGIAKRKLYTDEEAVILDACAPLILTGIGQYITRGDAADRALPVQLRKLRDNEYRPKAEIMAAFEKALPGILGGLCDALSCSLRRRGEVTGTSRMADFERAVEAAGPALGWKPGHFNELMVLVRDKARRAHVDDDELAQALIALSRSEWSGTVSQLRAELSELNNSREWLPRTAKALGNSIRRIEPLIEHVGVLIRRFKRGDERILALEWQGPKDAPKAPDGPEAAQDKASEGGTSKGASARPKDLGFPSHKASAQRAANVPPANPHEMSLAALRARAARSNGDDSFTDEELGRMADGAAKGQFNDR